MQTLNEEYDQQLQTAIDIFTDNYPKHFLHQLYRANLMLIEWIIYQETVFLPGYQKE